MAVTLKTIAKRVGVSVQAVSYVLNDRDVEMRISPERSAQIRSVAKELNYVPNGAARAMQTRKTRQIGVLVRVVRDGAVIHPRALETISGINAGLEPSGNIVVIIPVVGDRETDQVESRVFRERLLDGLVLLEDVPEDDAKRALTMVPAVVWVNGNGQGAHNCIRRDEVAVGRLVASELYALGYRKLVYADKQPSVHYSFKDRLRGALDFAEQHGLQFVHEVVHMDVGYCKFPEWPKSLTRDTAVIASDGYCARLLQGMFGEVGARPGIDFALACCDDTDEFAWTWPQLARVKFDRYAMGIRAAEMILERVANPRAKVVSETIRESWIAGSTASPLL